MERILVADYDSGNRKELENIMNGLYDITFASNGAQAVEILEKNKDSFEVVMYRFGMPDVSGYELLKRMEKMGMLASTPVLFINEREASELENNPISMGTYDFVHKPFVDEIVKRRVRNLAGLFVSKNELENKVSAQNVTLSKQFKLLKLQRDELVKSKQSIIDILGTVVECRSLESSDHISRIKGYTGIIARRMMQEYPDSGLTEQTVEIIVSASALHDIGKIAIPDSILNKPGKLTKDEFEFMKSHTIRGADIVDTIHIGGIDGVWDEEYAKICHEICRSHHERYDGKGYPDGLKGEEIPIAAQCESIADVYDALVTESVYKAAYSKEEAYNMIVQGECGVFSPKLLECFRKSREEFEEFLDSVKKKQ